MSTKDLMVRMEYDDDMRAALIYQRATTDADWLIAARLSALIDERRGQCGKADNNSDDEDEDGSAGFLVPVA